MTSIDTLAADFSMQQHEVAAFLDLGTDYDGPTVLDEVTAAEYREQLQAGADLTEANRA